MCGIGGVVVAPGAAVPREALERMAAAMAHRGPDDRGIEVVGNVGLVHTRLAIVDPTPVGHAPMAGGGGRWWLTYNGEAFNHLELRAALGGRPWRGGSDTETVVEALAAWGEDALPRINGLFGLAALDLDGGRLLLARDRFGVKPLYVTRFGGAVWFASELRALLAAGAPREADAEILLQSIATGWATGPWTPLQGVRAVLPGTVVEVALDTLSERERTWYAPEDAVDAERAAALARRDRPALRHELEATLRRSVQRRLMGDVPVATMCSGGVDSGLITALAREEDPGLQAFNVAFADQPEHDEGAYATRVAEHLGVPLHTFTQSAATWREGFVRTVAHVEYPLLHPSSVPMAQVAGLARSRGVKVLLSGEGADELFGGYGFLHGGSRAAFEAARRGRLRRALGALAGRRSGAARGAAAGPGIVPEPRGLSARVDAWETELERRCLAAYAHDGSPRQALEAGLLADLRTYLPHLLNRQDKTTMQSSVETRVPFLDPDVVALALNLPLEARVTPEAKGLVRELGLERLPREAVQRPKRGFGFAADRYLDGAADPGFLLDGQLRELLGRDRASWEQGIADSRFHMTLLLWSAEAWCRLLLGDQPVERVEADLWRDREAPAATAQPARAAPG